METLNIRNIERKDCKEIVRLIKELALYEKMLDQATMTSEDLERDGFLANPSLFKCFVAEIKEDSNADNELTVIGYALYFTKYSTWVGKALHLEDFYVTPKYRKLGVGTKLLKRVAQEAVVGNYSRMTLECLDWNTSALNYYKNLNAIDLTQEEGWHVIRFTKETLPKLANIK